MENKLANCDEIGAHGQMNFTIENRGLKKIRGIIMVLLAVVFVFYFGLNRESTFARISPPLTGDAVPEIAADESGYMHQALPDDNGIRPSLSSRQILSPIRVASAQSQFYQPYFWPQEPDHQTTTSFLQRFPEFRDLKPETGSTGFSRFQAKLNDLDRGVRTEPVVVLHIGDSHISSDSYTRGLRRRLQAHYGDAGRGAVIPSRAFKYAYADGVVLKSTGPWRSFMSLKTAKGVFGVSGVRVEASSRKAVMSITAKKAFDYAQVTVATGPGFGSIEISVDGKNQTYTTNSKVSGAKTITIGSSGKKLSVRPVGNGKIGVLHWSTRRDNPGVRYINFGQSGATVNVTRRWNERAVANDLKTLNPDLIVFGFGTNEGYDDNLNVSAYRKYASGLIGKFVSQAPNADVLIIGAADGLRKRRGIACGSGWYIPKKLIALRKAMKELADQIDAGYWDWANAMGGPCSINKWAGKGLAAKDRVHLTRKGYDASANAIYNDLFKQADNQVLMVSNQ